MSAINGKAALSYLLSRRPPNAQAWTVPRWPSPLSAGVFPIGVTVEDRFLPLGTAFTISSLGIVASALHNITAALEYDRIGAGFRRNRELPDEMTLNDAGLAILHSTMDERGQVSLTIWPLESCNGAPPTDLIFGFPVAQPSLGTLRLPLSFAIPRVGSKVYCVGYGDMKYPDGGISLGDIRTGNVEWVNQSALDLRVVEGRVSKILTKGVAKSFPTGPCVLIDGAAEHGQSGGPVLNDDGFVCGVVSAGASLFMSSDASVVSLLYPVLLHPIKFGVQMGPVRINATYPLIDRIAHGDVITDGFETNLPLTEERGQMVVGAAIHRDDVPHTFDDLAGLQEARSAERVEGPMYRLKRSDAGGSEVP